jgi:hypothetical protein
MLWAAGLSLLGAIAAVAIGRRRVSSGPAAATGGTPGEHVVNVAGAVADANA